MNHTAPTAIAWPASRSASLRRGHHPLAVLRANSLSEVIPVLEETAARVERGCHAIGFISYEAAPAMDPALPSVISRAQSVPLAWFCLFRQLESCKHPPHEAMPRPFTVSAWQPSVTKDRYLHDIALIRTRLHDGETYQVNYSYRLAADFTGDPLAWFNSVTLSTRHAYPAFIRDTEFAILSFSPELFWALDQTRLRSRPMKGTLPRGKWKQQDDSLAQLLADSAKDRAENVMIVDMVRNDLGRIATPGSVTTSRLLTVERHPTVLQMTSTVECRTTAPLPDLMRALFPAASITGAPKRRTMEIIRDLENSPRGIYTGAIGVLSPGRKWEFNVAIRTIALDLARNKAEYGVGGGIVWDSSPESEYAESITKSRLVLDTASSTPFNLLETILHEESKGFFLLDLHLARMQWSASVLGFKLRPSRIRQILDADAHSGRYPGNWRVRVLLDKSGRVRTEWHPLLARPAAILCVAIAPQPVHSQNQQLYHKTTNRQIYESAAPPAWHCDDVILQNERGELTESTIANIVLKRNGVLVTPPTACGLLPGIMRQHLLERGIIREQIIRADELRPGQPLFLINSVRRWRAARLVAPPTTTPVKCMS